MGRTRAALQSAVRERTRWPALDGVRGVAIVAVVAYHAFKLTGGWTSHKIRTQGVDWWWWPLGTGRFGVDLLFVLSGFLVFTSWRNIRARHEGLGGSIVEFARRRGARILPAYYVMLLVYVPLLAPELGRTAGGLWRLFLFLTLQQYNEPQLPSLFNRPLWALTVEMQFYVALPVVAFFMTRRGPGDGARSRWSDGARTAAPLLAALALTLWWVDHRGVYPTSWIFGRSDQFVAGMAVASLVSDSVERGRTGAVVSALANKAVAWVLAAALVVVALYHGSTLGLPRGHRWDEWAHPAAGLLLAGLLGHLVVSGRAGPVHRTMERAGPRLLGHLSYGIYLWHLPIYEYALEWTGGQGEGLASPGALGGLALATALTLAVAMASYAWVERPFLERKTRSSVSSGDPSSSCLSSRTGGSRGEGGC